MCRAESGGEVYYRNMQANKAKRAGQFIKPAFPPDASLIDAIIHAKVQSRWTGRPLSDLNHPWLRTTDGEQAIVTSNSPASSPLSSDETEESGSQYEEEAQGVKAAKGIILPPPTLTVRDQPKLALPPLPSPLSTHKNDIYVFWDIEDKHPSLIDPRILAHRLKSVASSYGRVRGVYAYITRKASNWIPDVLFEMAMEIKKGQGDDKGGASRSTGQMKEVHAGGSDSSLLRLNRKLSESLQNSPNKSVGRVASYHNSAGRPFALKPGNQLW